MQEDHNAKIIVNRNNLLDRLVDIQKNVALLYNVYQPSEKKSPDLRYDSTPVFDDLIAGVNSFIEHIKYIPRMISTEARGPNGEFLTVEQVAEQFLTTPDYIRFLIGEKTEG